MTAKTIIINEAIILNNNNITDKEISFIGGKARQLNELQNLGFTIPNWIVLSTNVLQELFHADHQISKKILERQLAKYFSNDTQFAVRSSALQEDGVQHSFAGQFETELNISFSNLWPAIQNVWKSIDSDHVRNYCKKNQIEGKPQMAIIIQEMVEPDTAGVAFGINPVTGDRQEKVISAVYGLGEGLVSGEFEADTYTVGSAIKTTIANKAWSRKRTSLDGTQTYPVPYPLQNVACLNHDQIFQIADVLDQLKKHFGKAQDIEFAFVNEKLFLLQTRPVTGLENTADQKGQYILWDNSNIVESYPGVTSPLTFSFILKVYESAYRQIALLFGVTEKTIDANPATYANLLGLIKGRVYYNLVNWYRMLAQLPGFRLNARFMENMMGVKEQFELPPKKNMGKVEAWFRVIVSILKMTWQLIRLPKNSKSFHKLLDQTIDQYRQIDFDRCRSEELMEHYLSFEEMLLKRWKAPLVNDLFAMIFFGLLQKLSARHFPDHPNLHNELVSGSGDIISTQPAKRLLAIAILIQKNEAAKVIFKTRSKKEIWAILQNGDFPEIAKFIQDYIEKFGDRCTGELKLETITYRQNPEALIHILKSYVKQEIAKKEGPANTSRTSAEAIVAEKLKGKWFRRFLFNYILKQARALVSGRENLRFERTRAFGVVRELFAAIGRNWYSEGILEDARDIFYLSQQEVFDFIKGTSVNDELLALIDLRKKSYINFENAEIPSERIATYGMVYHGNNFYQHSSAEIIDSDLKGIGCCPGTIHGKVQVVHHPSEIDSLQGDILVTTSTDPGWVALFPTASAILVERGSLLSHSAIVAREMGIPCIVGIPQLLKRIKTGDLVVMDGRTGYIEILDQLPENL